MDMTRSRVTRREIEEFLVDEAALLDDWDLNAWLELFTPEGVYLIPALDRPELSPQDSLYLIMDDIRRLRSRVSQLLGRSMWAENPLSRTRRIVANTRIIEQDGDTLTIEANFIIHRIRNRAFDVYVGKYRHQIIATQNGLRFIERKAILDLDALSPQGKISIII